jgi:hypothetical protein
MKPTENSKPTYVVTFRHETVKTTNILEVKHCDIDEVWDTIASYEYSYRSIEVVCEQTGEVVFARFYSESFWDECNI